jgi:hypothetical protein
MPEKPAPPRPHARRHADAVMFNYIHELFPGLPHWDADPAPEPDPARAPAS